MPRPLELVVAKVFPITGLELIWSPTTASIIAHIALHRALCKTTECDAHRLSPIHAIDIDRLAEFRRKPAVACSNVDEQRHREFCGMFHFMTHD